MVQLTRLCRGKTALAFTGLLSLSVLHAPAAFAGTATANLSVSATVTSNCTVATSPVAFGSINATSGSASDATGGLTVNCTSGTPWGAAAGVGNGSGATFEARKMVAGSDLLSYTLFIDAGRSFLWGDGSGLTSTISNTGTGSNQNATVYGRVASGQTSAPAGSYADTVAVTLTY